MIYIDSREGGSTQLTAVPRLLTTLSSHRFHPPCQPSLLPAADFCFTGNGPLSPVSIGIERKRLSSDDFFASVYSGRLVAEQIPKLLDLYDYCYLVIEGQARVDWVSGELEEKWGQMWRKVGPRFRDANKPRRVHTGEELLGMMTTISMFTPVKVVRTYNERDTVDVVATLWHWWTKAWNDHKSLKKIYTNQTTVTLGKASTVRRVAAQLKSVGWEKSGVVEQRFKSVQEMVEAGPGDWAELDGFGAVLSKRVFKELRGEHNDA